MTRPLHLVVTDSGLGGLAVCAGIEQALRRGGVRPAPRITYVNAWPDEHHGYNDLPEVAARAAAFDRALGAIDAMTPDRVLIACNTLSILYARTAHARRAAAAVEGIIEAGVTLFDEALRAEPSSGLVLIGTRTTVESGTHVSALAGRGIDPTRIAGASCHGLATAIETAPFGPDTAARIAACAARAAEAAPAGDPLLVGLCCTHYGLVAGRIATAIADRTGRRIVALDPNARMAADVVARLAGAERATPPDRESDVPVTLVSKVELSRTKRLAVAEVIEVLSPATARALLEYTCDPRLF